MSELAHKKLPMVGAKYVLIGVVIAFVLMVVIICFSSLKNVTKLHSIASVTSQQYAHKIKRK